MRNPKVIAAELAELQEKASKAFVPPNLARGLELASEFCSSVAATLEAGGLLPPDEAPAEQPQG